MTKIDNGANSRHERSAGIIVYRRTRQGIKFLLLYHGGGYWNFPKGHIESEEKSLETAIRETTEEAGLRKRDLRVNRKFRFHDEYSFTKGRTNITKSVIFYLAETRVRHIKISHEHDGFGWFSYKEAVNLLKKYKDNIDLLRKANTAIGSSQRYQPNLRNRSSQLQKQSPKSSELRNGR